MSVKLLYFLSHPIQYQAPLLRKIAADPDIDLTVIFESAASLGRHRDPGFGVEIEWDVPLTDGYAHAFADEADIGAALAAADAVWVHGWASRLLRRVLGRARALGKPTLMRGENWAGAMPDGGGLAGFAKRRYLARIFANCSRFLAIGSSNRAYYLDHGVAGERIHLMPYAVDNEFFAARAAASDSAEVRRALGLAPDRRMILFAGKLTPRKRPDTLLAAWRAAPWNGPRPALVFVGDGEMRQRLAGEAADGVVFAGFRNQTEMPGLYAAADVFVLAAEREPWGLAINEAMACGTAVIASDQCGAAADLVDDTTGRVVRAGDPLALGAALPAVLADAEARGRAARARIAGWDFGADLAGLKGGLEAALGAAAAGRA